MLNNKAHEERELIGKQLKSEKKIRDEIGKVMKNLGNVSKIAFKE